MRLNLLETQWPGLAIPALARETGAERFADLERPLHARFFGTDDPAFFRAWEMLDEPLPNATSLNAFEMDSHYYGPADSLAYYIDLVRNNEREAGLIERLPAIRENFMEAGRMLADLEAADPDFATGLELWRFAARGLVAKADELKLTVEALDGRVDETEAARLLLETEAQRDAYRPFLEQCYSPASAEREL